MSWPTINASFHSLLCRSQTSLACHPHRSRILSLVRAPSHPCKAWTSFPSLTLTTRVAITSNTILSPSALPTRTRQRSFQDAVAAKHLARASPVLTAARSRFPRSTHSLVVTSLKRSAFLPRIPFDRPTRAPSAHHEPASAVSASHRSTTSTSAVATNRS